MTMDTGTPGRRLTAKGRATRDRIVTAAAGLMYERGVAGTSTEDVQRAAGDISPSQLYHYFVDKKALVSAVIGHQTAAVLATHVPIFSQLDSFEALEAWRDLVVDLQRSPHCAGGCPMGSLASELADRDPDARAQLADGFQEWQAAIQAGLEAMHERGELDDDADPGYLSLALLTALQGGLLLTQLRRDTAALEAGLTAMIERIRWHATR